MSPQQPFNVYVWNPYMRSYVTPKGKPVDTNATRDIVANIRSLATERLNSLALRLKDGELTNLAQFKLDFKEELRGIYVSTHVLARGGIDQMGPSEWGTLGSALKEQYDYLASMVRDIENGTYGKKDSNGEVIIRDSGVPELTDGFVDRVGMYTESSWGAAGEFENVVRDRELELGSLERRVLGDSKASCQDCIELADLDWQPPGLMPDIGDTECGPGCNCTFEFENTELENLNLEFGASSHTEIGLEGENPTPDEAFTLYPEGKSFKGNFDHEG